jgi:glucan phosphoethanolaminetransferase (alkaline phosphatase superfamily)
MPHRHKRRRGFCQARCTTGGKGWSLRLRCLQMSFFETLSEDLSQPEYVHVLINPLPVYGLGMGVLALLVAFIIRSRQAQVVALVLIVVSAASAWPVFIYGAKGYQRVHAMSDNDGQAWLDAHKRRAEKLIYIYYVTAAVGLIAIVAPFRWPKIAPSLAAFALILAMGLLCAGGYIAYAGGKVRHREFRNEPPPEEGTAERHSE